MSPLACDHSRYEQQYTNTIDLYWYSINYHLYMPDASEFSLPLPDIRRLEQFVAVAESDTLADAATRVFVTQQALSTAIRRLENELGVSLFNREHRGLTLTPAGEDLLRNARAILTARAISPARCGPWRNSVHRFSSSDIRRLSPAPRSSLSSNPLSSVTRTSR